MAKPVPSLTDEQVAELWERIHRWHKCRGDAAEKMDVAKSVDDYVAQIVREAVAEERERCAGIADRYAEQVMSSRIARIACESIQNEILQPVEDPDNG